MDIIVWLEFYLDFKVKLEFYEDTVAGKIKRCTAPATAAGPQSRRSVFFTYI
jgi:hypothetical protein